MVHTIVIQSAREGTGKSTLAANIATLLAADGQRVGVIDADLQTESMRHLFGLKGNRIVYTLNDYLFGRCDSSEAIYDVTPPLPPESSGRVLLVPANASFSDTAGKLRDGYNIERVTEGLWTLAERLNLDTMIVDTHAMLSDDSLLSMLSIALSDTLLIVLCLDQQDYQGTSVIIDVARSLEVPRMLLVANQVSPSFDKDLTREQLEQAFQLDVAALVPHADEIMLLSLSELFVLRFPSHPVTHMLRHLATVINEQSVHVG